jgi:hypothetical protein
VNDRLTHARADLETLDARHALPLKWILQTLVLGPSERNPALSKRAIMALEWVRQQSTMGSMTWRT